MSTRPISPFLIIYSPQVTSVFSISERITGSILAIFFYFIILMLNLMKYLLSFYFFYSLAFFFFKGSTLNLLVSCICIIFLFSFLYHFFFGLRFLGWNLNVDNLLFNFFHKYSFKIDLEIANVYLSGYVIFGLSVLSTLVIWLII